MALTEENKRAQQIVFDVDEAGAVTDVHIFYTLDVHRDGVKIGSIQDVKRAFADLTTAQKTTAQNFYNRILQLI